MGSGYDEVPRLCEPCNALFPGWDALQKHKENKRKAGVAGHIYCKFCYQDFETEKGEMMHIQKYHAQEQDLECPGCGHGPFIRLAGLMSHIEKGECARIDVDVLEEVREKKLEFARKLEALTNEPIKNNFTQFVSPSPDFSAVNGQPRPEPATFNLASTDFPVLPGNSVDARFQSSYDNPQEDDVQTWDLCATEDMSPTTEMVKEEAAARQANSEVPAASTQNIRIIHEMMDPDHPSHPNFYSGRYWCEHSGRFVCPKVGCYKTFKKAGGVVSHLGSTAHGDITYRCPTCFRSYKSLTAITMHVESNGSRCRIRDSNNYDAYVDQLTAGMVDVSLKRHDDGTVAYKTAPKAREVFRERGKNFDDKLLEKPKENYASNYW